MRVRVRHRSRPQLALHDAPTDRFRMRTAGGLGNDGRGRRLPAGATPQHSLKSSQGNRRLSEEQIRSGSDGDAIDSSARRQRWKLWASTDAHPRRGCQQAPPRPMQLKRWPRHLRRRAAAEAIAPTAAGATGR